MDTWNIGSRGQSVFTGRAKGYSPIAVHLVGVATIGTGSTQYPFQFQTPLHRWRKGTHSQTGMP